MATSICQKFQFIKLTLLVKYLGVPFITSKLKKGDCDEFVQKISSRILSWTAKFLSYAGRLQLIKSVLTGIQNYWAGMFILPKSILKQVETLMHRFLLTGDVDKAQGGQSCLGACL